MSPITNHQPRITSHPVVLFDGVCNLCNRSVAFIIRHDPRGRFHFASLQSNAGRGILAAQGLDPDALNTVVLIDRHRVYTKSDAALRILRRLRSPWRHLWLARFIPRPLRDAVYDWVSRNRYDWFGKRDACIVPSARLRARFLDADEPSTSENPRGAPASS